MLKILHDSLPVFLASQEVYLLGLDRKINEEDKKI
jgi:hypothetical protein